MPKHPFDETLSQPWEAELQDAPGHAAGLYINGRLRWRLHVGDPISEVAIAPIAKEALVLLLTREFTATDKDGYACCRECSARKSTPPKHAATCLSGALCESYRKARGAHGG